MRPEQLARLYYETFQRLAPQYGYATMASMPWSDFPADHAYKRLMLAIAGLILRAQDLLFAMNETGGRGTERFHYLQDVWYRRFRLPPVGYNEERGCIEIYPPDAASAKAPGEQPPKATCAPDPLQTALDGCFSHTGEVAAHYVAYNDRHLTALVIGREGDRADLAVFTNMENAAGKKNYGLQFHQDVAYSAEPTPGTWHWIER